MTAAPTRPHFRDAEPQRYKSLLRQLHACAKQRGIPHADLAAVVGCTDSLTLATEAQLVSAIRTLGGRVRQSRDREGAVYYGLTLPMHLTGATRKQRQTIFKKAGDLGLTRAMLLGFLAKNGIADITARAVCQDAAHSVINQLDARLAAGDTSARTDARRAPVRRSSASTADPLISPAARNTEVAHAPNDCPF